MSLGKRLVDLRTAISLSQKEFAKNLGLTQQSLSNYENDRSTPSLAILNVICDKTGCASDWLFRGIGPIFQSPITRTLVNTINPDTGFEEIELGSQIAAGIPLPAEHEGAISVPRQALSGYSPKLFVALPVNGDSMEPDIPDGSLALIRNVTNWSFVVNHVAAIMLDGEVTLKRIIHDSRLNKYVLVPLNRKYDPYILDSSDNAVLVGILHATILFWATGQQGQ